MALQIENQRSVARMKKWRVLVNGTNLKMALQETGAEPRVRRMGFFTTVFVRASSPREAELKAVDILKQDKGLRASARNAKEDPPVLFADEIQEMRSFRGVCLPRTGLALYAERGPKRKQ